jgi:uncharacterized protein involved in type VI secretion and phage assembly
VTGPAAGANWGALYTPRLGAEVALQFIDGDIDRPVIVGGLYMGPDAKPLAAGVDSGVNHPGVIAGLHSQRLDGAMFNQFEPDGRPWERLDGADDSDKLSPHPTDAEIDALINTTRGTQA